MKILISMNNGDNFKFEITEENYKTFKIDISIYNWLKLNDYGYNANTEVYIKKENITYYGIVKEVINNEIYWRNDFKITR